MVVGSLGWACTNEQISHDELVVEGWICQDEHPIVLIHQSYALTDPKHDELADDATLEQVMANQMILWGRVAINDGTQEVVLTGKMDTMYVPPIIYTTTRIMGEKGKTYQIKVDYENYHATAYSTIEEPVGLDSLTVRLEPQSHTSHVIAYMSNVPDESYFLMEYRTTDESQFTICPMGTASWEQARDGVISMNVLSRDSASNSMTSALHHFTTNDSQYILRLIRLGKEEYTYYSALSNQLASQGMFFMSMYHNLPTNLNGAIGIWSGFGKQDYPIHINRDTTYRY